MFTPRYSTILPQRQRGVALYVVIVFVMLSMLLALWASRTALFNEMVVGNDADYQRAFEAAQAMMQDAERDIECSINFDTDFCKRTDTNPNKPLKIPDTLELVAELSGCKYGVCAWRDDWSFEAIDTIAQKNIGVRYGEFTAADRGGATNSLLHWTNYANPEKVKKEVKAWYWIEVAQYKKSPSSLLDEVEPNNGNLFAYRITAFANGLKPSSRVILQQVFYIDDAKASH